MEKLAVALNEFVVDLIPVSSGNSRLSLSPSAAFVLLADNYDLLRQGRTYEAYWICVERESTDNEGVVSFFTTDCELPATSRLISLETDSLQGSLTAPFYTSADSEKLADDELILGNNGVWESWRLRTGIKLKFCRSFTRAVFVKILLEPENYGSELAASIGPRYFGNDFLLAIGIYFDDGKTFPQPWKKLLLDSYISETCPFLSPSLSSPSPLPSFFCEKRASYEIAFNYKPIFNGGRRFFDARPCPSVFLNDGDRIFWDDDGIYFFDSGFANELWIQRPWWERWDLEYLGEEFPSHMLCVKKRELEEVKQFLFVGGRRNGEEFFLKITDEENFGGFLFVIQPSKTFSTFARLFRPFSRQQLFSAFIFGKLDVDSLWDKYMKCVIDASRGKGKKIGNFMATGPLISKAALKKDLYASLEQNPFYSKGGMYRNEDVDN